MITTSEKLLAENESCSAGKPWVLVRESYYQPSFMSGFPGMQFYTVLTGEFAGSDKTMLGLLRLGFRVEVVA